GRQLRLLRRRLCSDEDPGPGRRRPGLPGLARPAVQRHPGSTGLRPADERGDAMSELAPQRPEVISHGPQPERPRWLEVVMSPDHKDVGRIFIGASLSFLVLGVVCWLLMRLQLGIPEND